MRILLSLRRMVFAILPLIIGVCTLIDARETRERSLLVQQQPTEIRCKDLMVDGPPAENRHVKITAGEFADTYVWANKTDSDRWSYVLIPIHEAGVKPRGDGSDIQLVAHINVEDAAELKTFLARPEVVGFVWDTFRGQQYHRTLLQDTFPRLDLDAYRTVFLGDELPTLAKARREELIGSGLIGIAVVILAWMIWRTWQQERAIKSESWYAEENPRDSFEFGQDRSDPRLPSPQSNLAIALRTWAFYSSTVAIPVMGFFYCLMELKLAPDIVTTIGMVVGALMLMLGGGFFVWSYGKYVEQTYTSIPTAQLSQATRRHFEGLTPDLESWGFTFLGDLRVIDRVRASVRVLLSPDGKTAATMEYVFGSSAFNFYTVLPNGVLIHSCSVDLERPLDTPLPSLCYFLRGRDIASGYGEHSRVVALALGRHGMTGPVDIEPEWISGVLDYAHRISGWALRESGHGKRGVPPLPRPEQIIQWNNGQAKFAWRAGAAEVAYDAEALDQWRAERDKSRVQSSLVEEPGLELPSHYVELSSPNEPSRW